MELVKTETPATVKYAAEAHNIVGAAGQTLKIELSPGGPDVLTVMIPAGKAWHIAAGLNIDETDA